MKHFGIPVSYEGYNERKVVIRPGFDRLLIGKAIGTAAMVMANSLSLPFGSIVRERYTGVEDTWNVDPIDYRQLPDMSDTGELMGGRLPVADQEGDAKSLVVPLTVGEGSDERNLELVWEGINDLSSAGYEKVEMAYYDNDDYLLIDFSSASESKTDGQIERLLLTSTSTTTGPDNDLIQSVFINSPSGHEGRLSYKETAALPLTMDQYVGLTNYAISENWVSINSLATVTLDASGLEQPKLDEARQEILSSFGLDQIDRALILHGLSDDLVAPDQETCLVTVSPRMEHYVTKEDKKLLNPLIGLVGTLATGLLVVGFSVDRRRAGNIIAPDDETFEAINNGTATTSQKLEMLVFRRALEDSPLDEETYRARVARLIGLSLLPSLIAPALIGGAFVYTEIRDQDRQVDVMPELEPAHLPTDCQATDYVYLDIQDQPAPATNILVESPSQLSPRKQAWIANQEG